MSPDGSPNSLCLYRCGDDTYVAVPSGNAPPADAIHRYGNAVYVRAIPRRDPEARWWKPVEIEIQTNRYAVIDTSHIDALFRFG